MSSLFSIISTQPSGSNKSLKFQQNVSLSACEDYLLDKVYTFKEGTSTLTKSFYLENNTYYHVGVEIVTPHECDIGVALFDPQGFITYAIERRLVYSSPLLRDHEKEHCTADNGTHTFHFSVTTEENLNIYLWIRKGRTIDEERKGVVDVIAFHNEGTATFKAWLDTDWSYKFFVKRVSTNAKNESSECLIALNISDPTTLPFTIFSNTTSLAPFELVKFHFGTAMAGDYSITLYVYYEATTVNLAFGIIKDYKIGCYDEINETENTSNETVISKRMFSIPTGPLITSGIVAVCIVVAVITIVVVYNRKKNIPMNN